MMLRFSIILNLLDSKDSKPSNNYPELGKKAIFVYDDKNRKLNDLSFYSGYTITADSKKHFLEFCENYNEKEITFFIVNLYSSSIMIYNHNKKFLLNLERAS